MLVPFHGTSNTLPFQTKSDDSPSCKWSKKRIARKKKSGKRISLYTPVI